MSRPMPILMHRYATAGEVEAVARSGATFFVLSVPWEIIAPHEAQAKTNHGQTLERLRERGGLGAAEVVAILEDRPWRRSMSNVDAHASLVRELKRRDDAGQIARLRAALNQCRLAFAGHVSAQSAVDMIDDVLGGRDG